MCVCVLTRAPRGASLGVRRLERRPLMGSKRRLVTSFSLLRMIPPFVFLAQSVVFQEENKKIKRKIHASCYPRFLKGGLWSYSLAWVITNKQLSGAIVIANI